MVQHDVKFAKKCLKRVIINIRNECIISKLQNRLRKIWFEQKLAKLQNGNEKLKTKLTEKYYASIDQDARAFIEQNFEHFIQ